MPITRTHWIDDDGTGLTGTVINNLEKQLLYDQIDQALVTIGGRGALAFVIDGGTAVLAPGVKGFLEIPFAGQLVAVTLLADVAGSIVVDIWKNTFANFPPTVADTITAAAKPTITNAIKSQDVALAGWNKAIAAGDILAFNVVSAATIRKVTISLTVQRT